MPKFNMGNFRQGPFLELSINDVNMTVIPINHICFQVYDLFVSNTVNQRQCRTFVPR